MKNDLYTVILAGGIGSRFWPLSRELYPKQLLRLGGRESMLQRAVRCAGKATRPDNIYIVTHRHQCDSARMQVSAVTDLPSGHYIVEPLVKNTAAAIGLAAIHLVKLDPDAVMMVMPADHVILKTSRFARSVREAAELAREGWFVTFGVKPGRPETAYGYIRRGPSLKKGRKGYQVSRFTEKPDLATATRYVGDGRYYWNSGIFVWKASAILSALKHHQPKLHRGLVAISKVLGTADEEKVIESVYKTFKSISVDYGVLERLQKKLAVLPVEMGWSDVGSWTALPEIYRVNSRGNVITGNVVDIDSRDSILYADKRLVATVGLKNLIVVDTEDATLVCDKSRAQDVRKVVDILKKRKAEEQLSHRTSWRPWGSYTVLEVGHRYKIKRITVNPKARLSLQLHHRRSEHWVVVSGTARVTCGDKVYDLEVNQSTYVPTETKHRLENPGETPLQIIEVQSGEYLGEDDIVRFQDDYGRSKKGP